MGEPLDRRLPCRTPGPRSLMVRVTPECKTSGLLLQYQRLLMASVCDSQEYIGRVATLGGSRVPVTNNHMGNLKAASYTNTCQSQQKHRN